MEDNNNAHTMHIPKEPHHKLKELTERLTVKWRVKGPEIDDETEYRPMKGGFF